MQASVTVTGGGDLAGLTNGRPDSTETLTGGDVMTHDGRFLVIVRVRDSDQAVAIQVRAGDLGGDLVLPARCLTSGAARVS